MSKVNMGIILIGVAGVLGLTVAQSLQVRKLEARLAEVEHSIGGVASVEADGAPRSSKAAGRAGQLGMARAAQGSSTQGVRVAGGTPAPGSNGDAEAVIVGSEDQIAEMVAQQTQRMRDERRERWSQIGLEQTKETVREIAEQEGIDESKADRVVELLQGWSDDRRYLHEGLMDGSITVAEMREEMGSSREQLEQEVESILGQTAATALWEEMSSWRGRH